jgi:hypothetical protein
MREYHLRQHAPYQAMEACNAVNIRATEARRALSRLAFHSESARLAKLM